MNILRVAKYVFLLSMILGFRSMDERRWEVSVDEPVLWLELDEKLYDDDGFGGKADNLPGDLAVLGDLPDSEQRTEIWKLILADFDSVQTSYLRLRLKPGQIDSLDADNNYSYDETYAKKHTIELVVGSSRGAASGFATPVFSGSKITGCRIVIAPKTLKDPVFFKHVLTHETFHCLGFNHQQDDANSIMSYSNNSASMSLEERMALTHLYPADPDYAKETPTFGLTSCAPAK